MKRFFYLISLVIFASFWSVTSSFSGEDNAQKVKKCMAMVEKHTGIEASDEVAKLCREGKMKQAMQAAMSGD